MKLWIDDLRDPKKHGATERDWFWAKTSKQALEVLQDSVDIDYIIDVISFDHDLGGNDTIRPVVLWMCERDVWPRECRIHTANPVGKEWLIGMIARYSPDSTCIDVF